jgi:hypothetical protein
VAKCSSLCGGGIPAAYHSALARSKSLCHSTLPHKLRPLPLHPLLFLLWSFKIISRYTSAANCALFLAFLQAVPLVIGQFLEMVDQNSGIVGSTTGSNYYVRILSTLNRELLKPSSSIAMHRCALLRAASAVRTGPLARITSTSWNKLCNSACTACAQVKASCWLLACRHSNALVGLLPPEADSSISLLSQSERPDVTYQVFLRTHASDCINPYIFPQSLGHAPYKQHVTQAFQAQGLL